IEVVADDKQLLAVKAKLAGQRFAAGIKGRVGGIDASGTEGKLCSGGAIYHRSGAGGTTAGTVYERQAAVGAEKETDPNISAGFAPILVVNRMDLPENVGRAARR